MLWTAFRSISCLIISSAIPYFLKSSSISGNSSKSLKFYINLLTISWMALASAYPRVFRVRLFAILAPCALNLLHLAFCSPFCLWGFSIFFDIFSYLLLRRSLASFTGPFLKWIPIWAFCSFAHRCFRMPFASSLNTSTVILAYFLFVTTQN
jgi:hypothetical protein